MGNIGSGKSTLISLYNELDLFDKIQTAGEPFINGDSLDDFYSDLKNNSFIFQWQVIFQWPLEPLVRVVLELPFLPFYGQNIRESQELLLKVINKQPMFYTGKMEK